MKRINPWPRYVHRVLCLFGLHVWQHRLGEQSVYLKCAACGKEKRGKINLTNMTAPNRPWDGHWIDRELEQDNVKT